MGSVYLKPGRSVYMMKYYKNGTCIRATTGETNEVKARKVCAAAETDTGRGLPAQHAIGTLIYDDAVAMITANYELNQQNLKALRVRLAHLTPFFTGWKMADIKPADVAVYVAARQKDGAKVSTINRETTVLRRMFTLARQGGRLLFQPHIQTFQEKNTRSGFFEREQFDAVRGHLAPELADVITFAYVTGWRIDSEVLPLEWRQVDFDAGEVSLDAHTTKNGEPRTFPLNGELRTLLVQRRALADQLQAAGTICPQVFFRVYNSLRGGAAAASPKRPKPITRFNKAWSAATTAAGCPGRIPHDFRRTAVRNLVRRGVPERVAMQMTGHLTRAVFENYNIVSPGDLADARERIEGLGGDTSDQAATGLAGTPAAATGTPAGTQGTLAGTVASRIVKKSRKFGGAGQI